MTHHSVCDDSIIAGVTKPSTRAERRKAELRREIIDTAFVCFAEKGYHATGIADIAAHLGIGHGTFYRYFSNKRDIIDHVIDDLAARIIEALGTENAPDAATSLDEYREQIDRIGTALTRILVEDRRVAQLLLFHATGIDDELTERLYGLLDTADMLTAGYLEHGVELGYLREDLDTVNTARAVTGMLMAGVVHGLRDMDEAGIAALNEAIRRLLIEGVRKP
ncbi:TetR/AcrR family transcriptional regulator [Nocardia cyriacigeorgica]|jgi:AcrR family transcriptional regulator|uniref:TetR/AcrR family transcriptional regulator n=1 Tax=Nocardia cyriacigeorgica TaxID=135487 RepID=UPI0013D256F3|nr:TetR/AcrR family transcriptional regulator [Nocardia cyriacigeorgica]MBF6435861.1 TetR/AcrR family transcriptional regulator [Nocardia cyriacigeorgica]MBF6454060.1 TetR/AcrR family transcriptional regulator [Nocardia cyriacigeorgica]MBF6481267.1 TetR/AcrR family transcriptional regulator [Nocardia cyriacigeorgica]MBF6551954.1 TetR/AcrR family transcriptional regulator [Nocardia cyriacigeorgica]NEW28341.1 TetR/AcrR family transcriptional regulator [Nocardia cyriacigeorgica]